jgi:hypothetical protein
VKTIYHGDWKDRIMRKGVVPLVAALGLAQQAFADDALPDNPGGRYIFNKTADGVVRLDTQTGAVSFCSQHGVAWACEAAPEDRAVLENEIGRLRSENAALKKDILASGLPLPPGVMPSAAADDNPASLRLPSDADVDRMVAFVGRVWQRFVDAVTRAQKQVLNKS